MCSPACMSWKRSGDAKSLKRLRWLMSQTVFNRLSGTWHSEVHPFLKKSETASKWGPVPRNDSCHGTEYAITIETWQQTWWKLLVAQNSLQVDIQSTQSNHSIVIVSYSGNKARSNHSIWQKHNLSFKSVATKISQVKCTLLECHVWILESTHEASMMELHSYRWSQKCETSWDREK